MAGIRLKPLEPSPKHPEIPLARGESKVVGRAEQADVIIDEPSLSRRHAQVNVTAEGVVTVEDLGSTNHTFINDVQRKRGSLSSGDRVRFGAVEYELEKEVVGAVSADATVLLASTDRMAALKTLLIADDSATIRNFVELAFAAENITVIGVSNGDLAIARIDKDPPDIVLADVDMPGKDGFDIVRHLRQTPKFAQIPVLLLTDSVDTDSARAAEVGSDGLLGKPLDPHAVIARVKELLAKGRRPVKVEAPAPVPPPPTPASVQTLTAPPPPMAPPAVARPAAPPAPPAAAEVAKPPAPPKPTLPPPLADVFAALVAATPHAPVMPDLPAAPPAKAGGPALTPDLVNEIARRAIDQLSARVLRETGPAIISELAERLVKEEIDRLKSATK